MTVRTHPPNPEHPSTLTMRPQGPRTLLFKVSKHRSLDVMRLFGLVDVCDKRFLLDPLYVPLPSLKDSEVCSPVLQLVENGAGITS